MEPNPEAHSQPIERPGLSAAETIRRARNMPVIDYAQLRADLDAVFDPRLFPE